MEFGDRLPVPSARRSTAGQAPSQLDPTATPEIVIQVDTPPDFGPSAYGRRSPVSMRSSMPFAHRSRGYGGLRRFCEMEDKGCRSVRPNGRSMTSGVFRAPLRWYRFIGYIRPEPRRIDGPFWLGETEVIPSIYPRTDDDQRSDFRRGTATILAYFTDCKKECKEAEEAARGLGSRSRCTQHAGHDAYVRRRSHWDVPSHCLAANVFYAYAMIWDMPRQVAAPKTSARRWPVLAFSVHCWLAAAST
jgi:hypothetical protein